MMFFEGLDIEVVDLLWQVATFIGVAFLVVQAIRILHLEKRLARADEATFKTFKLDAVAAAPDIIAAAAVLYDGAGDPADAVIMDYRGGGLKVLGLHEGDMIGHRVSEVPGPTFLPALEHATLEGSCHFDTTATGTDGEVRYYRGIVTLAPQGLPFPAPRSMPSTPIYKPLPEGAAGWVWIATDITDKVISDARRAAAEETTKETLTTFLTEGLKARAENGGTHEDADA
jgi:hypothetical protein